MAELTRLIDDAPREPDAPVAASDQRRQLSATEVIKALWQSRNGVIALDFRREGPAVSSVRDSLEPIETKAHASKRRGESDTCTDEPSSGGCGGSEGPPGAPSWSDDYFRSRWWGCDRTGLIMAEALGVDCAAALEDSKAEDRRKLAHAFRGVVFTRTNKERADRLFACGHLRAAFRGSEIGLTPWKCKDRNCPSCAGDRANEYASALKPWVEHRRSEGAKVFFCTLTQVKIEHSKENSKQSLDRFIDSYRRTFNLGFRTGRDVREYFSGGIRGIEQTWSQKGQKRKDGTRVEYSGWHTHAHLLLEAEPGVSEEQAREELYRVWKKNSPGVNVKALDFRVLDPEQIHQVTKYPLKLPTMERPSIIREAALALGGRRVLDGFGTWRSALGKGRALRDAEKEASAPLRMADEGLASLRASREEYVSFTRFKGKQTACDWVKIGKIRDAIVADPRTFKQRDRDKENGVDPPNTSELVAFWAELDPPRKRKRPQRAPPRAPTQVWIDVAGDENPSSDWRYEISKRAKRVC